MCVVQITTFYTICTLQISVVYSTPPSVCIYSYYRLALSCLVRQLVQLVDVDFQEFCGNSVKMQSLSSTPAHFYVPCGLFLECPPEPRSETIVAATAPRVAVLSIPERVVGVPPRRRGRRVASSRLAVKVLPHKWWWTGPWPCSTGTITVVLCCLCVSSCIRPNMGTITLTPRYD